MVHPAIKAASPDQSKLQDAIDRVPDSLGLVALEKNLDNVWLEAQSAGKDAIQNFANTIREDSTWGDRLWARLVKGELQVTFEAFNPVWNPYSSPPTPNDLARFNIGKEWIRRMVDVQREKWAKQDSWFYYGNKPAPTSQPYVVNAIEAELWALWITQEDFQPIITHHDASTSIKKTKIVKNPWYNVLVGRSKIEINRVLPFLDRLGLVSHNVFADARPKQLDRLSPELTDLVGNVDTKQELDSIREWAANRKPVIFGGSLGSVPRIMGKLPMTGKY
jgi:hypothetical protein